MNKPSQKSPLASSRAKFVTGSTMRHVVVMTSAGAVGLMAIFLVEFADLYFLSLLGEEAVAAAIGYAGTLLFFTTSLAIGLSISATALVSRAVGAEELKKARRLTVNTAIFSTLVGTAIGVLFWLLIPFMLEMLGAKGRTFELAASYLRIIVPTLPVLALGISASALLRAVGDARRSMYVTISGGLVNAVLDPIFIFGLGLGVEGAAWASVASRFAMVLVGAHGILRVHQMYSRTSLAKFRADIRPILVIAMPAMATNLATPFGNAYVTASVASSGDSAVAGWAIIGRLIPVAFGALFALSGAVGPILGQNLGAKKFHRLNKIMWNTLVVLGFYTLFAWMLLMIFSGQIAALFSATGEAAWLIGFFCFWVAPGFAFFGALFTANAAFNNLGRPHYSTFFNWGRATIGTIPLVYFGSLWFGAAGAIAANTLSSVIFGIIAMIACFRLIRTLAEHPDQTTPQPPRLQRRTPLWPFSTPRD